MSTESIQDTIRQRFEAPLPEFYRRRIIFWCDEANEFEELFDQIELSDVKKVKLTGRNSFAVKKLLLHDDLESDYLIYDPLTYLKPQDDWLRDIRLFSEKYSADYLSMLMGEINAEDDPLMRKTVRRYKKFFENKERKLRFQKLGHIYREPELFRSDVMAVLAGVPGGGDMDVIIAVLSAGLDEENNAPLTSIKKFGDIDEFWDMVARLTGYEKEENDISKPLGFFAAHVLLTALSHTMPAGALKALEQHISPRHSAYCYSLFRQWQEKGDRQALLDLCHTVDDQLKLSGRFGKLDTDVLLGSDIFPSIDESLIVRFFDEIAAQAIRTDAISTAVEKRRSSCWYDMFAEYYESLLYIGQLYQFIEKNPQGFHMAIAGEIWKYYTEEGYKVDSAYRHLFFHFSRALENPKPALEDKLKAAAGYIDQVYKKRFLGPLADCWLSAAEDDMASSGVISGIDRQRDFYSRYVRPVTDKNVRAFVIISDGLRYETAVQLRDELVRSTRGTAKTEAMQSVFPSITSYGMAALLPGADLSVTEKGEVQVEGMGTLTTEDRQKVLRRANDDSVAARYGDILAMTRQQRQELVSGKKVIYIYHNTIDAAGDEPRTERKVFEACDDAVRELAAMVKIISNDMNGTDIFITADHGFLYTYSPLEENDRLSREVFSGQIYDLGRRYALTAPETTADFLLPVELSGQIGGVPIKGYTPRNMVRIKTAGAGENYVHGGVSLQEMTVPVVVFKNQKAGSKGYVETSKAELILISESRRISNSIFSLDFLQKQPVGDKVLPYEYTVYMAAADGTPVSDRKKIIADKTAPAEKDRVTHVTFSMTPGNHQNGSDYKLVIAGDSGMIDEIEFNVNIAFADDFGF